MTTRFCERNDDAHEREASMSRRGGKKSNWRRTTVSTEITLRNGDSETHHSLDLVGDPVGHLAQDGGREIEPVGGHKVLGLDRAQANDLLVRPPVSLHADGADGQQRAERLTYLVVKARFPDLLDKDGVGVLGNLDLLARDLAEDADREAGTRERVATDQVLGDLEEAAESADLVCGADLVRFRREPKGEKRCPPLKSSRRGSMSLSFMSSRRPPTLWWVLMVAEGPLKLIDSMTSGYKVPCKSHSISPPSPPAALTSRSISAAFSSNTSIKVLPMILRFCSGSVTPASLPRKRSEESTTVRLTPRSSQSILWTCWASFMRRTPLSTMMAWKLRER